jgi:hypothetical protein
MIIKNNTIFLTCFFIIFWGFFTPVYAEESFKTHPKVIQTTSILNKFGVDFFYDEYNISQTCIADYGGMFFPSTKGRIIICNKSTINNQIHYVLAHELAHVAQWCNSDKKILYPLGKKISYSAFKAQLTRSDIALDRVMVETEADTIALQYSFDEILTLVQNECRL